MVLTRDFKETVRERAAREPVFAKAMLDEAANAFLDGDQNRPEADENWLRELDGSIEQSLNDMKAGRVIEATKVFDRFEAKYKRMAAERAVE